MKTQKRSRRPSLDVPDAVPALAALAHETRLRVFRTLVAAGPSGRTPGELAAELGIPAATLSFHLKELRTAGLVDRRRDGRTLHDSVRVEGVRDLIDFLVRDCCGGSPDLCGLGAGC